MNLSKTLASTAAALAVVGSIGIAYAQTTSDPTTSTPPATEAMVQTVAKNHARFGRASDIGSSITSGGIGKNELSANDTAAMIQRA